MKKFYATLVLSFIMYTCYSQSLQILDLSLGSLTQTISPQTIKKITLINRLPNPKAIYTATFDVSYVKYQIILPSATTGALAGDTGKLSDCKGLLAAKKTLDEETNTKNVSADITALQTAMKAADQVKCANTIKDAQSSIDNTNQIITLLQPITLGRDQILKVTVTQGTNTWTFTFNTPTSSHWLTTFGLTYATNVLTTFPNYYANQQADGTYIVTRMHSNNQNVLQNLSPTAMFTYEFFKKDNAPFKFGLTGGFMYNTDVLGGLFGPTLVIGDNITLNTGVTFTQKYALNGQYTEGQSIKDNLTFDQLHSKIWTYDIFFSIGFNIPSLFNNKNTGSNSSSPSPSSNSSTESGNP